MEPPFDDVTSMPLNVKRRARLRVSFLLNGITDRRRHRLVSISSFRLKDSKVEKFSFQQIEWISNFRPTLKKKLGYEKL